MADRLSKIEERVSHLESETRELKSTMDRIIACSLDPEIANTLGGVNAAHTQPETKTDM